MIARAFALAAVGLALASTASCQLPPAPLQWEGIAVASRSVPLAPGRPDIQAAGQLKFRGGLELSSDVARFGGFSGLVVREDGALVAVSDAGVWLRAQLVLDGEGALIGLEGAQLAAMRDEAGEPLTSKRYADAEDIALLNDGRLAVSFEQEHRILIYDLFGAGPMAPATPGPPLGGRERLSGNEGLEGLTTLVDGRLVGAAEFPPTDAGAPFWLLDPAASEPSAPVGFTEPPPGYGLVGLARLPDGDLLRVERFYLPMIGTRLQIRRIAAAELTAPAPSFDGAIIATFEPPMALDNFESIAVVPSADGSARIYLLSDDNFSSNQRTLLYAFDYAPPGVAPGAPAPLEPAPLEPAPEDVVDDPAPPGPIVEPAPQSPPPAAVTRPPPQPQPQPQPQPRQPASPRPPAPRERPAVAPEPELAPPPVTEPAPEPTPQPQPSRPAGPPI